MRMCSYPKKKNLFFLFHLCAYWRFYTVLFFMQIPKCAYNRWMETCCWDLFSQLRHWGSFSPEKRQKSHQKLFISFNECKPSYILEYVYFNIFPPSHQRFHLILLNFPGMQWNPSFSTVSVWFSCASSLEVTHAAPSQSSHRIFCNTLQNTLWVLHCYFATNYSLEMIFNI